MKSALFIILLGGIACFGQAFTFGDFQSATTGIPAASPHLGGNILTNSDFETGQFYGWYFPDGTGGFAVQTLNTNFVHTGTYGGSMGPGSLRHFVQTNATDIGASYQLSFFLHGDGQTPNQFQVIWNGATNFDQSNLTFTGWTNMIFTLAATATNTVLSFGFQNSPSFFGFDDITLQEWLP